MPIGVNGSGTITGISVGGLPDGIVDTDMLATEAVTGVKQGPGSIVQFVNAAADDLNVRTTTTSTSYVDTTLHIDITPTNSTNKIIIGGHVVAYHDTSSRAIYLNIHNGSAVASDDVATKSWQLWASTFTCSPIYYIQTAGTTNQMTFSVYYKCSGGSGTAGIGYASSPGSSNTNGHQLWAMEVVA